MVQSLEVVVLDLIFQNYIILRADIKKH